MLQAFRQEHSAIASELKSARSELDRIEREKRAAAKQGQTSNATPSSSGSQSQQQSQQHQGSSQYRAYTFSYGNTPSNPPPGTPLQLYPSPQPVAPPTTTDIQLPIAFLPVSSHECVLVHNLIFRNRVCMRSVSYLYPWALSKRKELHLQQL